MKTKYKHISKWERKRIEELTQDGNTNKEIAKILGRPISTIGRELKRNWGYGARWYKHERAQELSDERRKASKVPRISEKTWRKVFDLYNVDWSPEQISGALKSQGVYVSHETIYRRIYAEIRAGRLDRKHLRRNRKKRRQRLSKRMLRDLRKFRSKSVQISVHELNSATGKAIPLSSFVAKVIWLQWSNEKHVLR